MKKCTRCGECCNNQVCEVGALYYKTEKAPCPGLLYEDEKCWCELIKDVAKDDALFVYMGIGLGCEWRARDE